MNHTRLFHCGVTLVAMMMLCTASIAVAALPNPFYAMDTVSNRGPAPLEQKLDDLKALGYTGLCWTGTDVAKIRATLAAAEQRGLKVYADYVAFPLTKDALNIPENFDELCAALSGHGTVIWVYITSKDFKPSTVEADAVAVPALQAAADRAAKHGLKLALYPHYNFWAQSLPDCLRIANKVDRANFGVSFNLCHVLKTGDESRIPELLRLARPKLFMVTLNGADAGAADAKWDRLIQPLGRGTYDVGIVLKTLKEIGYTGPIGFQGYGIKGERKQIMQETMEGWKKITAGL